jgi:two-component system sensor histidine kinase UhpB
MSVTVGQSARLGGAAARARRPSLYQRLLLFNALVVVVAGVVLTFSPVTISHPVLVTEVAVLAAGAIAMVAMNAVLVRATLRPLDRLSALMERVDLLRPGERVSMPADRDVAQLVRKFNEMLDRLEQERGVSSAHALAAQEGERQRIARELHDEIGQGLTAVLLDLRRTVDLAPPALRDELQVVQETVRGCLDEVRMVARRLRPGVLEDLGLRSAVAALATDVTRAGGLPVDVTVDPRLPALGANAELVIYRIAQEGLTNVARHADATRVELTLVSRPGCVELTINDDGRGVGRAAEGAGIRGMRERAILVGATLSIGPAPGGGTRLGLGVPTPPTIERT